MTGIEFHFNAPGKLGYACRLLRKAAGKGAKVVVTGNDDALVELDALLWTFSPLDFVAHCRAGAPAAMLQASPILLARSLGEVPHHDVLVNLGDSVPEGFERFERLIEVVAQDEADRAGARQRWKHYASRGYGLQRKDLELKESA